MNPMTGMGNSLPSYQKDRAEVWAEIRKLWKKVGTPDSSEDSRLREIVWSYGGVVNPILTTAGQPWPAPFKGTLASMHLTLAIASSLDIVVTTVLGGSSISTDILPAGSRMFRRNFGNEFDVEDTLYPMVNPSTAGTGQSLGIIYRYEMK